MFVLVVLLGCICCSVAAPATGTCMCVVGTDVYVRDAGGLQTHILAQVSSGECYTCSGSILVKDGYTWYELQNVHGLNSVWIASHDVQMSTSFNCSRGSSAGTKSKRAFASGIVSDACLQCLCLTESYCSIKTCNWDVNSYSCGYFQIKEIYWTDCYKPGDDWESCAGDIECSSRCVQAYMSRYITNSGCPRNCEGFARLHNGGPRGCDKPATLTYWNNVKKEPGCSNVQ